MSMRRRILGFAALLAMWGACASAQAQSSLSLAEQDIKAGLIYNFLKYTNFPADEREAGPVRVCLAGKAPLGGRLAPMAGRTVNQRAIVVSEILPASDLGSCTLVFLGADAKPFWPALSAALAQKDVLTIGDYRGFADAGGMIEFLKTADRIEIRINSRAIDATHLSLPQRIMALASAK